MSRFLIYFVLAVNMLYLKVLRFNQILKSISRLFSKSDSYLLIEILNHYVQVTFLKVYPEKKQIRAVKNLAAELPEFNIVNAVESLKLLLRKFGKLNKYKLILSLDADFATTIYSSVALVRPHPKEIIDEGDLDNLISQAIWRFFDRHRLRVAQKMGIEDVDVLLSDVRIRGIKLNGHKVVNPIGFKAKAVEIFFSQTFMGRALMRELRELLPRANIVLITEAGTALSHVLSQALAKDSFLIANLFPDETAVYQVSGSRLSHLDNFGWGEKDLHHLLGRYFRVEPVVASSLIANYSSNNASRNFLRRFENILTKELQVFVNGLESLTKEEAVEIYLNSFFTLPPVVFSDRFHNRFQKPLKLLPLSTNLVTEKFGYAVEWKKSVVVKNSLSLIAAFLEVNFLPQNDKLSHLANRRVRWLIT